MHESNENGHVTLFRRFGGAAERRKRNAQKQLSLVGLLAAVGLVVVFHVSRVYYVLVPLCPPV